MPKRRDAGLKVCSKSGCTFALVPTSSTASLPPRPGRTGSLPHLQVLLSLNLKGSSCTHDFFGLARSGGDAERLCRGAIQLIRRRVLAHRSSKSSTRRVAMSKDRVSLLVGFVASSVRWGLCGNALAGRGYTCEVAPAVNQEGRSEWGHGCCSTVFPCEDAYMSDDRSASHVTAFASTLVHRSVEALGDWHLATVSLGPSEEAC